MDDGITTYPNGFEAIVDETNNIGFEQRSAARLGSLLSTLAVTKPSGRFLELGTGSGLSTAWLLHGMNSASSLVTVDDDPQLVSIAKKNLGNDLRVKFIIAPGEDVILGAKQDSFDFIFADTWPGKYNHLEETLLLLKQGGMYIIDDMSPQDSWPEGHAAKAENLIQYLENRNDFQLTKMNWSTGIVICSKTLG